MTAVQEQVRERLTDFLLEEAAALDERRWPDWLAMLSDDFVYEVPVPQTREDPALPQYADGLWLAHESKSFLTMRFGRIASDYAWAERPAAYVRHFVTNLRVLATEETPGGPRYTVTTNVLVTRSRLPESTVLSSAGRRDVILDGPEGLLLQHRVVHLDSELPNDSQTSIIY